MIKKKKKTGENKEEFNPLINFSFYIHNQKYNFDSNERIEYQKQFIACELEEFNKTRNCKELIFEEMYTKRISEIKAIIGYRCENLMVCLPEDEKIKEDNRYNPPIFF